MSPLDTHEKVPSGQFRRRGTSFGERNEQPKINLFFSAPTLRLYEMLQTAVGKKTALKKKYVS